MNKRVIVAVLALAFASPALADARIWRPDTKVRLEAPANGQSTPTTLVGKQPFTFFAFGETTCLCIGQTTCGPTADKGGLCIEAGSAIDFGISGEVPISCWSQNGMGVCEIMGWTR